jgi:hypothetical protein
MSDELTKALLQFAEDNDFVVDWYLELSEEARKEYTDKLEQYKI